MEADSLIKYYSAILPGLLVFTILIYFGRKRFSFTVRAALLLLFYTMARLSLRLVPVGIVPHVAATPLFYIFLACPGVALAWIYTTRIEGLSWQDAGWTLAGWKKNLGWGFVVLAAIIPASTLIYKGPGGINPGPAMFAVALGFGVVLGGFVEETIFRGVIQAQLRKTMSACKAIVLQAILFSLSHVGYFPLDGYAVFYLGTLLLGVVLGILREKAGLLSAAIVHGGIVVYIVLCYQ